MPQKTLKLGQRLEVIAAIDFGPYGLVVIGDKATVVYSKNGETQISVDRFITEMCEWENEFTLTEDESCDAMRASLSVMAPAANDEGRKGYDKWTSARNGHSWSIGGCAARACLDPEAI
jgi:hypothetical protein